MTPAPRQGTRPPDAGWPPPPDPVVHHWTCHRRVVVERSRRDENGSPRIVLACLTCHAEAEREVTP